MPQYDDRPVVFGQSQNGGLQRQPFLTGLQRIVRGAGLLNVERLRQQRMIGVGEDVLRDRPTLFPGQPVLIDQQAHHFGYRHCRVGVVQLNGDGFGQRRERSTFVEMGQQNVLQARADEKILLLEAQLLALWRGIVRIQHAR